MMKANKVTIELRPYDALAIYAFMREFINDDNKHLPAFAAIHETLAAYEKEIFLKVSDHHLNDALLENKVNYIANRQPPRE